MASLFSALEISLDIPGRSVWLIKVDLPEPDTPVTQTKRSKGSSRFTDLRLWPSAPDSLIILFSSTSFLFEGISIFLLPDRNWPVIESLDLAIWSAVPWAQILPPWTPAPGPMSTTWSDDCIVSWSCSTTITVFPRSLNFFKVLRSFSLSLWCNPIEGSSRI